MIDLDEKTTLHALYSAKDGNSNRSMLMLFLLIGNAALQIYSHIGTSAVVFSSIPINNTATGASNSTCAEDGAGVSGLSGKCDSADWAYWESVGRDAFPDDTLACAGKCFITESCISDCFYSRGNYTRECASCFGFLPQCVLFNCNFCLADQGSPECAECTRQKCFTPFENCTGLVVENSNRILADAATELYEVYEISFGNSIRDAWDGEAYVLALVIAIFSGAWPYGKNIIMLIAWFVPLKWTQRDDLLRWLTRLAKWSLIDVFAVIFILAGVQVDSVIPQIGTNMIVMTEARSAIFTFAIAAIWDLNQGEYMKHCNIALFDGQNQIDRQAGTAAVATGAAILLDKVELPTRKNSRTKCSGTGKAVLFTLSLSAVALALTGSLLDMVNYSTSSLGQAVSDVSYSSWNLNDAILNELTEQFLTHEPGQKFMIAIMLLFGVIAPCMLYFLVFLGFVLPLGQQQLRWLCRVIDYLGGFAAMDVFCASLFVVMAEWEKLMTKSVGAQANAECPCELKGTCFLFSAQVETGVPFMLAACLVGYVVEYQFTSSYSLLGLHHSRIPLTFEQQHRSKQRLTGRLVSLLASLHLVTVYSELDDAAATKDENELEQQGRKALPTAVGVI